MVPNFHKNMSYRKGEREGRGREREGGERKRERERELLNKS